MSATSELAALRAFAVAALPLVEHYKARRCSYISEHHVSQVDAAIDAMDLWKSGDAKPVKFDVLDLIREPDNYTSSERAQAAVAIANLVRLTTVSIGNIRSLGPAGALDGIPYPPYQEWLGQLKTALDRVGGAA